MKRIVRMRIFHTIAILIALTLVISHSGYAANGGSIELNPYLDSSIAKDVMHAMRLGVQWLEKNQQENGCWSSPSFPAMTALAVSSILNSPDVLSNKSHPESVKRGLAFIVSCVQDDGGIYTQVEGIKGGGLSNYNTAICIMALADSGIEEYRPIIGKARRFLIKGQHKGNDVFNGGMGYDADNKRPYADLSNTVFALEALRRTSHFIIEPKSNEAGAGRLDWDAAIAFVSRCQHLKETNDSDWVSESSEERGGFVYNPVESKAGEVESADESSSYLRSYGSMTYAGLLSLLYADAGSGDSRIQAAVKWILQHWTLDENPGMGAQGLYYCYHTMAKSLNAYGKETFSTASGKKVTWRSALAEKLVSLQRIDSKTGLGYWQNDNNRWWENDANLVTAYTLLALEYTAFGRSPLE